MIKVNDKFPAGELQQLTAQGMINHNTAELFANKKVVMFAVPGAFTPTCSQAHLPGYVVNYDQFKAKGVDAVICTSVNDAFVMDAWGKSQNAENILMLGDGDGSVAKALGLSMETGGFGGLRSQRYAMVVENGVVTHLHVEAPKEFEVSKAESVLAVL
ncbi:peroxiredoxin [Thalassomonas sp. M1454]|uniref:peroxiredoxin n=1 Tax=Thalassomonas sp. M1454 TaxID=2594477 RepID=UPI00117C1077|nr:peroxiredoxin [Thalassomonas sp. M1454]TRX54945.1 peroxiredoxin [Thalassomonas sp. M1454]